MTKSTTPLTDAASLSLAFIRNSKASRMAYFVPSEVARGLELEMNKRGKVMALKVKHVSLANTKR